jgi:hypothetical protein
MRSIRAELLKLRRPLTLAVSALVVLFAFFQATVYQFNGGQHVAALTADTSMVPLPSDVTADPPPCLVLRLPEGPACVQAQREFNAGKVAARDLAVAAQDEQVHEIRRALSARGPVGSAALAVGLWGSLLGAVAIGLLMAGQVASEWTARTLRTVLIQDGRRARVLAAKSFAVWAVAAGLMLVTAASLAVVSPLIAAAFPVDPPGITVDVGVLDTMALAARATVVLGWFVAVGLLCSVLARNPVGAIAGYLAVLVAMLVAGTVPGLGAASPAAWVTAWMGFGDRSLTARIWVESAAAVPPAVGLAGLVASAAACVAVASARFDRLDVTV